MDHILSEHFTMTHRFWVTLNGMAHNFTELHNQKAMIHEGAFIYNSAHMLIQIS